MEAWRGSVMACLALATVVLTDAEDLATYDQRQTGELNVHVHVKNVSVVAFLDGAYGYDYSYDYEDPEELTPSEPQKPSTATNTSPTSTTVLSDLTTTSGPEGSDQKPVGSSRRCRPGSWRDNNGRCRINKKPNGYALQNLPFLMRLLARPGASLTTNQKHSLTQDRRTPFRKK
ncbi:uncharacterized protein LOC110835616 isoform X2 [Zootermopsis nevadensis]|uniref:uncharacterized protein LOC110835616 isoform X2 n=1 Tax=Zootermopsis nevadensis TaxID=136037 RepID=UPI000B8ECA24|nr:uncharacterized protein LOC110835616 isoform X2 [Zootermopsis nevadensis]